MFHHNEIFSGLIDAQKSYITSPPSIPSLLFHLLFFVSNYVHSFFQILTPDVTYILSTQSTKQKMVNRNILVGALAAAATGVVAQESNNIRFGNALSLGATNSYIVEAETTLYPGETQSGDTPRMALWPGMGTDESQLIQAIVLESTDAQGENCGGAAHVQGQWCAFASALQDDVQLQGDTFAVTSKQGVKIHCMFPTRKCYRCD